MDSNIVRCQRSYLKRVEEKRDIRNLEEGIHDENSHFEECLREDAEFWDKCRKEAEAEVPNKIIKVGSH